MLRIWFGDVEGPKYLYHPDWWLDNQGDPNWITGETERQMILDVDKSEVYGPNLVISPILGGIPPSKLSGGVKALVVLNNRDDVVINASVCGDNCAKWILQIAEERDVLIQLGHTMRFKEPFEIKIENTGEIVYTERDYVLAAVSARRAKEVLQL